jgi:hypothetical protein
MTHHIMVTGDCPSFTEPQPTPLQVQRTTQELTAEANAAGVGYKADGEKDRWDLLPWREVEDVVKVLTYGARKYADDNWQKVPGAERRYVAALHRHEAARRRGEYLDPESGLPHRAHALCCLLYLAWFDNEALASGVPPRPPPASTPVELSELERLRAQRDDLQARNTELVEQRRAVEAQLRLLIEAQADAVVADAVAEAEAALAAGVGAC